MLSRPKLKDYIEIHLVNILEDRFTVRVTPSYNVHIKINATENLYGLDLDLMVQILDILRYIGNTLNLNFYFDTTGSRNPFINLVVEEYPKKYYNVVRFEVIDKT